MTLIEQLTNTTVDAPLTNQVTNATCDAPRHVSTYILLYMLIYKDFRFVRLFKPLCACKTFLYSKRIGYTVPRGPAPGQRRY